MAFDGEPASTLHMFHYDFKRMVAAENAITIGSDWAHGLPLPLFQNLGGVEKKLGAEKLLSIITLAGATAVGRDKVMPHLIHGFIQNMLIEGSQQAGSIEVGKTASFICVDRDLSQGDFSNAKVLKTWFEGEIVFDASSVLI